MTDLDHCKDNLQVLITFTNASCEAQLLRHIIQLPKICQITIIFTAAYPNMYMVHRYKGTSSRNSQV